MTIVYFFITVYLHSDISSHPFFSVTSSLSACAAPMFPCSLWIASRMCCDQSKSSPWKINPAYSLEKKQPNTRTHKCQTQAFCAKAGLALSFGQHWTASLTLQLNYRRKMTNYSYSRISDMLIYVNINPKTSQSDMRCLETSFFFLIGLILFHCVHIAPFLKALLIYTGNKKGKKRTSGQSDEIHRIQSERWIDSVGLSYANASQQDAIGEYIRIR